jgi:ribosomal protein L11 methyltransferase
MTVVSCSVDERYVNPLFEVFDGGDFVVTAYRDVEETSATMQIFVPDPADAPRAAEALVSAGRIVGLELAPATGTIPDEDWKLSYRKHFKVEVISPRLVVRPPWEAVAPAPGQKVLTLDPGIAFGTGQHPTTRACLDAIDALAAENADRTFLDVGCGSGILSIAAALEGFRDVRGFDNDPDAVRNANENAEANGLGALFSDGDLSVPGTAAPADVVAANVLAPVLVRFAREVGALVNPGGRLILSGILDEQYAEVRDAYAALGFTEISNRLIGEWRTGLFARGA